MMIKAKYAIILLLLGYITGKLFLFINLLTQTDFYTINKV